jgi:hypothetical protein
LRNSFDAAKATDSLPLVKAFGIFASKGLDHPFNV